MMHSEKIITKIEEIKSIWKKEDIYPFPYEDVCALKRYFVVDFKKRALRDSCLEGDFNTYFSFTAGLASGGIIRYLHDDSERNSCKKWLKKAFFQWFPLYRFMSRIGFTDFPALRHELELNEKLRFRLLDLMTMFEDSGCPILPGCDHHEK